MTQRRIGILTGGGDSPGLNAAIRGATLAAIREYGMEVYGFIDGFNGLFEKEGGYIKLDEDSVQDIHSHGGTILGTANKGNPFKMIHRDEQGRPIRDDQGEVVTSDRSPEAAARVRELGIEGLLCIGGDGTLAMARDFYKLHGVPVVGVPKTIDFDLAATEATFGFLTAVQVASDALDRLRTTADSHDRVLILEVMGRYAGWIALHAGIAGGAHAILVPEVPYDPRAVWARVNARFRTKQRKFSIVVISEGAHCIDGSHAVAEQREHPDGHVVLGGAGQQLRYELEALSRADGDAVIANGGWPADAPEVRVVVLGHIQRGGTPLAEDRIIATACGAFGVDLVSQGSFGTMAAWGTHGPKSVRLDDALEPHFIDADKTALMRTARAIGIIFGDEGEAR
ncbi:MAG: 6-phosphofructokinase [Myxococcota bacterium]|jgi:6-phosphofructokinase